MDITDTLAPKSDQLDAVDLLGGPQTFTITGVKAGSSAEQPVEVKLAEFARVWRPGKSMRRVLAAAWTPHASEWTGRRVTLFCDPDVRFGGVEVGGIRISHMSHLDGPKKVPLLISKGKSAMFLVEPLADAPPVKSLAQRIDAAVARFAAKGIGIDRLEARLGRERAEWTADDVAKLGSAWMLIECGESTLDDEFPQERVTAAEITGQAAAVETGTPRRGGRQPKPEDVEDPTAARGFGEELPIEDPPAGAE